MYLEQAAAFDAQDRPMEATQAYEKAMRVGEANLETYLNLAVLYFVCTDGGYLAHHNLSEEFIDAAWRRANELLDEAQSRFGSQAEIEFWRRYFSFIVLGEEPFVRECEKLVRSHSTLLPFFYLFTSPSGEKYLKQAQQLFEAVKDGATAKKRYVRSVLEQKLPRSGA